MNFRFRSNREVPSDEVKLIADYFQQNGWLAFQVDEFKGGEIPDTNTSVPGAKSPSVQLREALFKKHMTSVGSKQDFPEYYQKTINGFIRAVEESY